MKLNSKIKFPASATIWTLIWQMQLRLRRIGALRFMLGCVSCIALLMHFALCMQQREPWLASDASAALQRQQQLARTAKLSPEQEYGAHYALILALLKSYGLEPQRTGFDNTHDTQGPVYSFDVTLNTNYTTLYRALDTIQHEAQARVTRLSIERDSITSSLLRAQVRISFSAAS